MKPLATVLLVAGAVAALIAAALIEPRNGHPVTPWMSSAATAATGRTIVGVPGLATNRPTVLIFILPGCPCSEDYEPWTQRLAAACRGRVDFRGIVVGSAGDAGEWQLRRHSPFPLIPDPKGSIARSCEAVRSAYTAVVLDGQTVSRLWPGYSAEMLREVSGVLEAAAQMEPIMLDLTGAPERLTSGCPLLAP